MHLALRDMSPSQQSDTLSDFLHNHRFPLVGVQFSNASDGARQAILYGYAATDIGKSDAEKKVRAIIDDPKVAIVNRIQVRPEIASMSSPDSGPSTSQPSDVQTYANQDALQQYQQQQPMNDWMSLMLPLLGFGLGSSLGGGSSSFSFGSSPSPFYGPANAPYSPYGPPSPFFGPGVPSSPYP